MHIELFQGPDKHDPFAQHITINAVEVVDGVRYGASVRLSDVAFLEGEGMMSMFEELAQRVKNIWSTNPKTSHITQAAISTAMLDAWVVRKMGASSKQVDTVTWRNLADQRFLERLEAGVAEIEQNTKEPLLPKHLLNDLEVMDEKRAMEHMGFHNFAVTDGPQLSDQFASAKGLSNFGVSSSFRMPRTW